MQSHELRTLQMESASHGNLHTEMCMRHPEYLIVAALMVYSHSKGKSQKAQKAQKVRVKRLKRQNRRQTMSSALVVYN